MILLKMSDFKNTTVQETKEHVLHCAARSLLCKDVYGFDIFRIELEHKNISSIRVEFVSKTQQPIDNLLANVKYNFHVDAFALLFYGDFAQNANLIPSGIMFPMQLLDNDYIVLDILNIKKLLPLVDDLDIVLSATEVVLDDLFSKKILVEQWFKRTDTTCNLLVFHSGLVSTAYARDLERGSSEEIEELMETTRLLGSCGKVRR